MYSINKSPYSLSGLGIEPVTIAATVASIASKIGAFIKNFGFTNDNGVIAARDKIFSYIRQVYQANHGLPRESGSPMDPVAGTSGGLVPGYKKTYSIDHSDINNVGTKSYYQGVLARINKMAVDYILNHAADSSTVFKQDVNPQLILQRYEDNIKAGMNLDHAFWTAFTGKKNPYDIKTGTSVQYIDQHSGSNITNAATVLKDAQGTIIQVRDAAGNILKPGTPEYDAAVKNEGVGVSKAGMGTIGKIIVAGLGISAMVFIATQSGDASAKKKSEVKGLPAKKKKRLKKK